MIRPLTTWSYGKLGTSQFSQRYNHQTWLEYICEQNDTIAVCHVIYYNLLFIFFYIAFYVMWSCNLLKLHSATSKNTITTKLGGNTYKNERVEYLDVTWVNYAKVMKTTAPKVAFMKGTNPSRSRDIWLYDTLTNKKKIWNFCKSC